jgi:hypothetical protein
MSYTHIDIDAADATDAGNQAMDRSDVMHKPDVLISSSHGVAEISRHEVLFSSSKTSPAFNPFSL